MTKRHFEAIARIFALRAGFDMSTIDYDNGYNTAVARLANDMADYFETENPRFDRDRFMEACGL
jgi:hypothetical protein